MLHDPLRGAECAVGEGLAAAGLVCEFHPLAIRGEDDRVIAHHVAAADGVDADLAAGAFADYAFAAVTEDFLQLDLSHVAEDFEQRGGRAAGRVLLQAVVHLDDFEVEAGAEDFGGLAGEPEERVHAGRVVRGPDHGNLRGAGPERGLLLLLVSGGADNERLAMPHAEFGEGQGGLVEAEVDDGVGLRQQWGERLAEVDLSDYFEPGHAGGAGDERLAHAALRAGDDDFGFTEINIRSACAFHIMLRNKLAGITIDILDPKNPPKLPLECNISFGNLANTHIIGHISLLLN